MSDFVEIWAGLDVERIASEILGPEPERTSAVDFEDAKQCVYEASQAWLEVDLANFDITGVETLYLDEKFKAYLDLEGRVKAEPEYKGYRPYAGRRVIFDWKTTSGSMDAVWADRLLDSWQWRLYANLEPPASLFVYRGIRRPGNLEELQRIKMREIQLEVPGTNGEETREFLEGMLAHRNMLVASDLAVWPRSRPDHCNAYNKACPFTSDCDRYTMPRTKLTETGHLSYSSIKTLQGCPEKYRRLRLLKQEGDDTAVDETEETRFGQAVHRGLAEVYRQAYKIKES